MDNFCLEKRNIRVAISPVCNFNCAYCDGAHSRKTNRPGAMEDFRQTPLAKGVISTKETIEIIKSFYLAGFRGVAFTGGEPLLNPDWDKIVNQTKEIGMTRVGVTTNGSLLEAYLAKNKYLPKGLTLLTLSFDTHNPIKFNTITGSGDLNQIIRGVKKAKKSNPNLLIRANKIVMRNEVNSLLEYFNFCEKLNIFNEINLLNLILKDDGNQDFFRQEFISASEILYFLNKKTKYKFYLDDKHEYRATCFNGLEIILKDTNLTLRNELCKDCSVYCQEGFFTIRVATDGSISVCPDYQARLPFLDGIKELRSGQLTVEIKKIVKMLKKVKLEKTLDNFLDKKLN